MKNRIITENINKLCDAIDIDYQVDFVKEYAKLGDNQLYGGKHCGSDAEHEGARFIASKLEELGIKTELVPCKTTKYQFNDATITVTGESREIKPYGYASPGTDDVGITGQLMDIDKSTKESYEKLKDSPKGKIGLMAAMGALEGDDLAGQMEEAVLRGVSALVIYAVEDVLNEDTIRVQTPLMASPVPIVGISKRDTDYLKEQLKRNKNTEVTLKVDAEYLPEGGVTYNVVGEIPGMTDERIIFTAHLDHFFRCLQDNISSCSTLLGFAKAFKESGYKPNRTITFAFHGSHETGGSETRYPYIVGSYRLTHEGKPEWTGKAIANINFEYTALHQKKLTASCFPGADVNLNKYMDYAPELVGGFNALNRTVDYSGYYMASWCDAIAYHTAGIPAYTNDIISEQMLEGESPYIGRDHSNFDDWDVFDKKALEDNGRFYGGLGMYIDSWPYLELDFVSIAAQMEKESKWGILEEAGLSVDKTKDLLVKISEYGTCINEMVTAGNEEYLAKLAENMTDEEKAEYFKKARPVNEELLRLYKVVADELYKINAMDFLCLGSSKYAGNIGKLQETIDYINKGKLEEALTEALAYVDLCMASYYFSEEVAEHMRNRISSPEYTDKRTWAKGRELHTSTHYAMVEMMREKAKPFMAPKGPGDFVKIARLLVTGKNFLPKYMADVVDRLKDAIIEERRLLPEIYAAEEKSFEHIAESLKKLAE